MNPFGSSGNKDDTPFDGSGLKIKSIKTRRQLNEAEFHHRAVWVHPFEDGNGRWARLLANIWLMQHDQPVTIWPASDLRDTESPIGGEYIAAMKHADLRNYGPLIDLHKRFSDSQENPLT